MNYPYCFRLGTLSRVDNEKNLRGNGTRREGGGEKERRRDDEVDVRQKEINDRTNAKEMRLE